MFEVHLHKQRMDAIKDIIWQGMYSSGHKKWHTLFAQFSSQILLKFETQWKFWILLFERILKHPLQAWFDEVLAELSKVKHKYLFWNLRGLFKLQ